MKSKLTLVLLFIFIHCFSVYEIGDVVPDFSWLESDGSTPVTRSLYQTIQEEKVLVISFVQLG